jgi:hypothetical protein
MEADQFSLANIPFGIARSSTHPNQSVVTRLGNTVIFLVGLCDAGLLPTLPSETTKTFYQVCCFHGPWVETSTEMPEKADSKCIRRFAQGQPASHAGCFAGTSKESPTATRAKCRANFLDNASPSSGRWRFYRLFLLQGTPLERQQGHRRRLQLTADVFQVPH